MVSQTRLSLLAILLVAVTVECQRGDDRPRPFPRPRPGGRTGRPSIFNGDRYEWEVDLGSATLVTQKAFISTERNMTVLITRDAVLAENNMTNSVALYDPSGMVAIKLIGGRGSRGRGIRSPCFLTSTTLSFDDIVDDASTRNGTEVALPLTEVTLNATSEPMGRREVREIFRTARGVARFCRGSRMIQTTAAVSGAPEDPDTETKSTVTLEGQLNVIMKTPVLPVPGDGFPRPGGRFPRPFPRPGNGFPRPGNGITRPGFDQEIAASA